MKRRKYTQKFIEDNIRTLQHFIEDGYSLSIVHHPEAAAFAEKNPWLCVEDGKTQLDESHDIPLELLVEYWKFRFNEERVEANRLYAILEDAYRKVQNG